MKDRRVLLFAEFRSENGEKRIHQCTELVRPENQAAEEKRLRDQGALHVWSLGRANIDPEVWARASALTKARLAQEQLELFKPARQHHP